MKIWFGAKVMILGMLIVFVGLVILIAAIKVLSAILNRKKREKAAPVALAAAPAPVAIQPQDDLQLVAVIMAAILAGEAAPGGAQLVVRSVRRLGGNAWAGAGRREQLGI